MGNRNIGILPDNLARRVRGTFIISVEVLRRGERMRGSAVVISSTIPSAKYSCSGSALIFTKGRTAIDGLSRIVGADAVSGFVRSGERSSRTVPTKRTPLRDSVLIRRCSPRRCLEPSGAKLPAVILLHGTGGVRYGGVYYAAALNRAGIATLEIDQWGGRGLPGGPSSRPRNLTDNLSDMAGAYGLLAARSEIDADRIGVFGSSMSGIEALLMMTRRNRDAVLGVGKHLTAAAALQSCARSRP